MVKISLAQLLSAIKNKSIDDENEFYDIINKYINFLFNHDELIVNKNMDILFSLYKEYLLNNKTEEFIKKLYFKEIEEINNLQNRDNMDLENLDGIIKLSVSTFINITLLSYSINTIESEYNNKYDKQDSICENKRLKIYLFTYFSAIIKSSEHIRYKSKQDFYQFLHDYIHPIIINELLEIIAEFDRISGSCLSIEFSDLMYMN